jgi:dTDP-glucose 4,6-dehydratase
MKLLVTGGAGFIGSNLIRHFLANEEHQILNIDKLCFPGSYHTISDFATSKKYNFIKQDIVDEGAMRQIFNEFKPDAIFHLAAESHVDRSIDSPKAFIDTNIVGTYSLLEAFRQYYLDRNATERQGLRFVHVSTDEVYGSLDFNDPAFTEEHTFQPNSPYSASKAASDHLVKAWHSTYKLPLIITNCSNNYGPYQFPEKLIPLVTNKALAGESIPVYGEGANIRDWLYVKDHVRALSLVLDKGAPGETYNIGGNNEKSNIQIVNSICELLDEIHPGEHAYRNLIKFVDDRPGHDFRYAIDNTKIRSELGWCAMEDFEEGLRKTINWYIDNKLWCNEVCSESYKGQRLGLSNI